MREMNLPEPEFRQQEVGKALVRVTLRNNIKLRKVWVDSDVVELLGRTLTQELSENQKRCINFVAEHKRISVSDTQRLTGLSWPAAKAMLNDLVTKHIFEFMHKPGKRADPGARYVLINTNTDGSEHASQ
jgi:predicted HTH transcriptional regulator